MKCEQIKREIVEGRHEEGRGKEVESSKGVRHLGCAEWGEGIKRREGMLRK